MSSRPVDSLLVILRSVCAGIAGAVGAIFLWLVALFAFAIYLVAKMPRSQGGSVGIDVVTLAYNFPISTQKVTIAGFVIGFAFGFRYFYRPLARHQR